jgi:hypothetical protein
MHIRRKPKHESGIKCDIHKVYSLSCDDYDALWERSGGVCEACGFEPDSRGRRGLVIDHDHKYGNAAVRGLICRWCNTALGALENPDVHPAFGPGPGGSFRSYLHRAWFVRVADPKGLAHQPVDRALLDREIKEWRKHNKALFSTDPKAALVPLDKAAVTARILREEMSHHAFAALVRAVNAIAEDAKEKRAAR